MAVSTICDSCSKRLPIDLELVKVATEIDDREAKYHPISWHKDGAGRLIPSLVITLNDNEQ